MRIGIDIDGVLTDLEQFMYDYGTKFSVENGIPLQLNLGYYDEQETFGWTDDQALKFWNTYLENYVKKYPMRTFAAEIIQKLKEEGNEIYIITARNEYGLPRESEGKMSAFTEEWLKSNHVSYDRIIYTEGSKLKYCIGNYVDVMIEDNGKEIKELATKIPVLCFGAHYNKNIEGNNITRVYSWYEIYQRLHK